MRSIAVFVLSGLYMNGENNCACLSDATFCFALIRG